ncbi:hypothetical protein J3R30DRAFT_1129857 [Lentinula aciculospora]|uniref:CBM21 domain-containing protein n=1 Tax=Lentinula aciculospora TaxID=153920 RepID=A0A9W9A0I7_9AGAR|nr:hypothetical protein J3R30DRAFT_1129857 [Lentinula aciculospora]
MPYSQPSRSSSPSRSYHSHSHQIQNHSTSTHSLGRPGHRRSYSSQAHYGSDSSSQQSTTSTLSKSSLTGTASTRFSNEQSIDGKNGTRGAWGSLGSLPRRHSSGTTLTLNSTSKFRIGDRRESSSSDDDNENDDEHQQNLPPLKFKVQVLPSFSEGVPFPKSSADSPVRMGPMSIPNPANVTMTRSSAPTRTTSSPAMITLEAPSTPAASPAVILLSTGKPLRSSLKGSRVSSLLNSPMGSAANSPSISPVNSVRSSPANSTVTSPITSPGIAGPSAPSFASFANFNTDSTAKLLAPPSFNGHVRAQSAPSPPTTPGQGIEEVLESTWTAPISPTSEAPLSPGVSEPMPPDALLSPRSVHFPSLPTDLERIRVFRKEARPSSLLVTRKERDQITSSLNHVSNLSNGADGAEGSGTDAKSGGEETETETETDREYGYGYNAGYWGTWGGRGLWDAAASSRSNESSSMKVSSDQPTISTGAFPFPRLPRLGRTRSAGGKDEDGGESSSSSSSSGGRIRIRNTGTGPRFARKEEEKEQVGNSDKRLTKKVKVELDVPSSVCHVPRPESVRDALSGSVNIFLEELHLENSSSEPFALEGTFLVRNITFEKNVFVRFTTDDWSTVNEVRGKWVDSCGRSRLISLGSKSSFGINVPRTLGDLIVVPDYTYTVDENSSEWDRFTFRINLPPAPALRPGRIVEFVGKFVVGNAGGEWWDNCGGRNWRIGFKEVEIIEGAFIGWIYVFFSPFNFYF